ncbi:hypothetical protein [Ferroplasma acidiphilum]|nr:hypothetical protein [Ferroplasma acidiphilum]WMT53763.1 MAG: hypothetical protein RE473_02685 [Ferroplasma acidiphilum]
MNNTWKIISQNMRGMEWFFRKLRWNAKKINDNKATVNILAQTGVYLSLF